MAFAMLELLTHPSVSYTLPHCVRRYSILFLLKRCYNSGSKSFPIPVLLCKIMKFFNYEDSHRVDLLEVMEKVFISQGVGKEDIEPYLSPDDVEELIEFGEQVDKFLVDKLENIGFLF